MVEILKYSDFSKIPLELSSGRQHIYIFFVSYNLLRFQIDVTLSHFINKLNSEVFTVSLWPRIVSVEAPYYSVRKDN